MSKAVMRRAGVLVLWPVMFFLPFLFVPEQNKPRSALEHYQFDVRQLTSAAADQKSLSLRERLLKSIGVDLESIADTIDFALIEDRWQEFVWEIEDFFYDYTVPVLAMQDAFDDYSSEIADAFSRVENDIVRLQPAFRHDSRDVRQVRNLFRR